MKTQDEVKDYEPFVPEGGWKVETQEKIVIYKQPIFAKSATRKLGHFLIVSLIFVALGFALYMIIAALTSHEIITGTWTETLVIEHEIKAAPNPFAFYPALLASLIIGYIIGIIIWWHTNGRYIE